MRIRQIETLRLDVPVRRPHHLALTTIREQHFVLVRLQTDEGLEGLGEAATLGGPTWNEESAESIQAAIDRYLAPYLVGEDPSRIEYLLRRMDALVRGNLFAKAALEMALYDLRGKALGVPAYDLLGGLYREAIPLSWSLATGDAEAEIAEAEELLGRGLARIFKVKIGAAEPAADVARLERIAAALRGRAVVRVDVNQGWDEPTTLRWLPALEACEIDLFEQPVPRWNLDGMARIAAATRLTVMADESLCTPQDAVTLVKRAAADAFALKLTKAGGFSASKKVAAVAEGAGLPCYMGCMIETALGTAAYAHFVAATPNVTLGCELFGPLLLAGDVGRPPIRYADGQVWVPRGPGLGVELDEEQVARYRRPSG